MPFNGGIDPRLLGLDLAADPGILMRAPSR
jgi:hypothetical protein